MENIDRSFDAALEAVLESGKQHREIGSRRDSLLKNLVNIGYENQFSPEDRVKARRNIKEIIIEHLGQNQQEVSEQ
jgi:hypothetical protein